MLSFQPAIPVPFMALDEYSRQTQIPRSTLEKMATQGRLILKKKESPKEKVMVNLVAMTEIAAREALAVLG